MDSQTDTDFASLVEELATRLQARDMYLSPAESCTGGWLAKACTDMPGSSRWFERGFVTYTNEAKQEMLGVCAETLQSHGAVSEATVTEMASGALQHSRAQISVAVSGIAGPGGGSEEKPVGTVCFAWALSSGEVESECCRFDGERDSVRAQAVKHALQGLIRQLQ